MISGQYVNYQFLNSLNQHVHGVAHRRGATSP